MKKFEYKIVKVPFKPQKGWSCTIFHGNFISEEELQLIIQEHGEEGWELVQVLPYSHVKFYLVCAIFEVGARLIFKREITQ